MRVYPQAFSEMIANYAIARRIGTVDLVQDLAKTDVETRQNGSTLDILVNTPTLGKFEMKLQLNRNEQYCLDQLIYVAHGEALPICKSDSDLTPTGAYSLLGYEIRTGSNTLTVSVRAKVLGKVALSFENVQDKGCELKRIELFDAYCKRVASYQRP